MKIVTVNVIVKAEHVNANQVSAYPKGVTSVKKMVSITDYWV